MIPSRTMLGFGEAKSCEPGHRARLFPRANAPSHEITGGGVSVRRWVRTGKGLYVLCVRGVQVPKRSRRPSVEASKPLKPLKVLWAFD